ncbi:MAG: signal peptidase II [Deltaproteobacteria bacterium]|nr:signal peptidase II [Deltaproteobacteria bacterium]
MRRRYLFVFLVALVLVVLDQWTKLLAVDGLTPGFRSESPASFLEKVGRFYGEVEHPCLSAARTDCPERFFLGRFWSFEYHENPGAAWSFLARADAKVRVPFFVTVSAVAIVAILLYLRQASSKQRRLLVGLTLVLGGAIGNFIDRARMGYVIDFIVWYIGSYRWPTFNVADSAISTGVALLILDSLLEKKPRGEAEPRSA